VAERRRRLPINRRREALSSEIAQIKQRIAEEYQAATDGLTGLSSGTAKHLFITQKMKNMEKYQTELEAIVGQDQAMHIMNETIASLSRRGAVVVCHITIDWREES
jgi:hypothetical protein